MCLYGSLCLSTTWCFKMFVGIIPSKPSQDFTRPLGSLSGLKGLLHTLNAIVHPMKEGFILLFYFILFFIAKGLVISRLGGVIRA
jgi:hypothetical protein